ncbi:hypothetical protein MJO28_012696 [Puccinia striiformis f. sp. tritici]|uniref:Uncharacterized protein n=1 Tax=Puccinia striiformis f. sp. tritici TaxID=168172 RepID=A0ACC0E0L8_9BASI|nr:hypothetical protein MJO28_012696 [Puccinia striiformis f. sp. tritici]
MGGGDYTRPSNSKCNSTPGRASNLDLDLKTSFPTLIEVMSASFTENPSPLIDTLTDYIENI